MVRTVALGLSIAGIMPITLANSSSMATNSVQPEVTASRFTNLSASCSPPRTLACQPKATTRTSAIHSELWLGEIATSLLPNSSFLKCAQSSLSQSSSATDRTSKQTLALPLLIWRRNLALPALGTATQNDCGFAWQQQLSRQSITSESNLATATLLRRKITQGYGSKPEFPKLSRTSLVVAFPTENSTFSPKSLKLTNPAPETKRIASPFGWRTRPYSNSLQFHQGIDYGAPYGSDVVAVGNGIVTRVVSGCADFGNLFCGGQLGNWVEIDHGNGAIGTYGHLKRSSITVKEGMRVRKNQSIAQVGSSGWSTGAHLDFRLKVNGKYENPAKYVMAIGQ